MINFNEKSALITGGSRGLGKALARRLAAEGAKVVVVARHKGELDETVREINGSGGTAFGVVADVGDKEIIYPIVGQAAALAGPVDVLIDAEARPRLSAETRGRVADRDTRRVRKPLPIATSLPAR